MFDKLGFIEFVANDFSQLESLIFIAERKRSGQKHTFDRLILTQLVKRINYWSRLF